MDTNIVVGIIGVFGIALGSILGGVGFLIRSKSEVRKVLNCNIYNLFQIWHIVNILEKFDSDKITKWYVDRIKTLIFDEPPSEDQNKELHRACSKVFGQLVMSFIKVSDTDIKQNYLDGISELSKAKPVLAFELNNNLLIKDLLDFIEPFVYQSFNQIDANNSIKNLEGFNKGFGAGVQASKQWMTKDFSKDLKKSICRLAFASGIFTWISCKRKIQTTINKFEEKNFQEYLDKYIEEAVKPVILQMKK